MNDSVTKSVRRLGDLETPALVLDQDHREFALRFRITSPGARDG